MRRTLSGPESSAIPVGECNIFMLPVGGSGAVAAGEGQYLMDVESQFPATLPSPELRLQPLPEGE